MTQDLYPAKLLCSRICHDLVTPVGAVLSGLELLEENVDGDHQDIIGLIRLSATECSRRLTLLRFCFGAGTSSSVSSLNDLDSTFKNSIDFAKHSYHLNLPERYLAGSSHLKTWAQMVANLFSIGIESLPYGGEITITSPDSLEHQIEITLKGRLITLPDEIKTALQHGASFDELTPRTIQAYLVWRFSQDLKRRVNVNQKDGQTLIYTQAF